MTKSPQKRHRQNDLEILTAFWYAADEVALPDRLEDTNRAVGRIRDLLFDGKASREVVRLIKNEFGVVESTAWKYIGYSKHIFGNMDASNKAFTRAKWRERIEGMWQDANDIEDEKLRYKAQEAAAKLGIALDGLDKEDAQLPDFGSIEPPVIIIMASAKDEKLEALAQTGSITYDDLTEDIVHEELQ